MNTDQRLDPYLAPETVSPTIVQWSARLALVAGLGYLGTRTAFAIAAPTPIAVLLLATEALGAAVFALRAHSASATPTVVPDVPDAAPPAAVAVVDARSASADELRITLVSCRRVRGLDRIVVADPDAASWLPGLAERFGATVVHEHALDVLAETNTAWVLHLRAGDLPMPDALEMVATISSAPDVGVVQFGLEEADPSSYEHDPDGGWSLTPFEHQVVRRSLAARGSIPWYGDGPALVRPVVVRGATDVTSTVDLGLHAIRLGYRVTLVGRTLARVRGSQSLGESLAAHARRRAPVRAAARTRLAGLPPAARFAHRVALIGPLAAIQRLSLVGVAIAALGFGVDPVPGPLVTLAGLAALAYGSRWGAQLLLGRGRLRPFSLMRNELRTLGVDLAFGLADPVAAKRRRLIVLGGVVAALNASVLITSWSVWQDQPGRLATGTVAISLAVTVGFVAVATEVLLDAALRRQRRRHHRMRLGLVTCTVEGRDGQLRDLSTGGAGVIVAARPDQLPERGTVTDVSFRIPDAAGAWRDVTALAHVSHVVEEQPGECRLGLRFDDPSEASLDPVVEFLTVDRRLVALGRRFTESV
ncbi:MAG: PilZ domain-containing protein [Actinomycetota bacterium]